MSFKSGQTSGGMWLLGGGFHNPQGLSNSHLVPPLISITCVYIIGFLTIVLRGALLSFLDII